MIRNALMSLSRALALSVAAAALTASLSSLAVAQSKPAQKPGQKPAASQSSKQKPAAAEEPGKPSLVATIGDWGVYVTSGGAKQCYALAQPKERAPKDLKRDPAYLFISSRPSEKIRNEVSIIMGFDVKASDKTAPEASVGADKFALASQGSHLWVKEAARSGAIVDAMRKGSRLTVKAASPRGNVTTDSYSLSGIGGALDRVQKECP